MQGIIDSSILYLRALGRDEISHSPNNTVMSFDDLNNQLQKNHFIQSSVCVYVCVYFRCKIMNCKQTGIPVKGIIIVKSKMNEFLGG
jgi:hypothetical protein